jgi:hypothetical protein
MRGLQEDETGAPDVMSTDERSLADWIVQTCFLFGADVVTAHRVAALFIEGLRARKSTGETHASV